MRNAKYSRFVAAALMYVGFAVYLYQPHFKHFNKLQYLLVVNVCLASLGCYGLSRRWVSSFCGSFFAGAIYGFGPFSLGLAGCHATAGLLAATVPWLFYPAVFGPTGKWRPLRCVLSALPFLAIPIFFQISTYYRLFPVSTQAKLHLADLVGLLAPLVMVKRNLALVGFYHVPIAALLMGASMLLAARRLSIIVIFTISAVLSFCNSFLNVSPIIWLAVAVLCCSVLIGAGTQGLLLASFADNRWVLATSVTMAALSIVTLLLATKYFHTFAGLGAGYAKLFVLTGKMYILGTIAVAILFFVAQAKLRISSLRWVVLCSAMLIDIFYGARFIVDKIL